MNLATVDDGIWPFDEGEVDKDIVDIGLERMIDGQILNDYSLIIYLVAERPDTVVSWDRIVGKVEIGFCANIAAKDSIALIFDIVLLIVLFIGIDLRVGEIDSEVDVVLIEIHIVLDLLRRRTRLSRIRGVIAGWDHGYVFRVLFWWVFAIDLHCCVQGRA